MPTEALGAQIVDREAVGSEATEISRTFPPSPFFAGTRSLFELWAYCMPLVCSRLRATRAVVCSLMAAQSRRHEGDVEGERVRRLRLRADGRRALAVNLEETILLTRKLFELRDAVRSII